MFTSKGLGLRQHLTTAANFYGCQVGGGWAKFLRALKWGRTLHGDIKEIVGLLMRVLDGDEVRESELSDLGFEAEGDLETALNEAYVQLGEFARALDLRRIDPRRSTRTSASSSGRRCARNARPFARCAGPNAGINSAAIVSGQPETRA